MAGGRKKERGGNQMEIRELIDLCKREEIIIDTCKELEITALTLRLEFPFETFFSLRNFVLLRESLCNTRLPARQGDNTKLLNGNAKFILL